MADVEAGRKLLLDDLARRKALERRAVDCCLSLLEGAVEVDVLAEALKHMQVQHYQNAIEDRAASRICGYPLCSARLSAKAPTTHLAFDRKRMAIVDMSELDQYCSKQCYAASRYAARQIASTPLAMRTDEDIRDLEINLILPASAVQRVREQQRRESAQAAQVKQPAVPQQAEPQRIPSQPTPSQQQQHSSTQLHHKQSPPASASTASVASTSPASAPSPTAGSAVTQPSPDVKALGRAVHELDIQERVTTAVPRPPSPSSAASHMAVEGYDPLHADGVDMEAALEARAAAALRAGTQFPASTTVGPAKSAAVASTPGTDADMWALYEEAKKAMLKDESAEQSGRSAGKPPAHTLVRSTVPERKPAAPAVVAHATATRATRGTGQTLPARADKNASTRLDIPRVTEIVEDWSTVATWQWLAGGKTRRQPEVVAASGGGEEELDVLLPPLGTTSGDHIRRNMVFSSLRRTMLPLLRQLRVVDEPVLDSVRDLAQTFSLTAANAMLQPRQWVAVAFVIATLLVARHPSLAEALNRPKGDTTEGDMMRVSAGLDEDTLEQLREALAGAS